MIKTLFIAYNVALVAVSVVPLNAGPAYYPGLDKIFHATAYAILCVITLQFFSYGTKKIAIGTLRFNTLLYCVAFGMLIETIQYFVPGRDFSLLDWGADILGAFLALLLWGKSSLYSLSAKDDPGKAAGNKE